MTNFKKVFLVCGIICFAFVTNAQDYKTAIGARLGGLNSGITVKGFVNSNAALEGILGFGNHSFVITGLYEPHKDVPSAAGLNWYYGAGAHIGFFRYGGYYSTWFYDKHGHRIYVDERGNTNTVFGIDFILGLDYKFATAPINLGLDIKPFLDFSDGAWGYFDGALSARFAF